MNATITTTTTSAATSTSTTTKTITGLDKIQNLSLPFGQPAQSSVSGQTSHENSRPRLVLGRVTDEICSCPRGKSSSPRLSDIAFVEPCITVKNNNTITTITNTTFGNLSTWTPPPQTRPPTPIATPIRRNTNVSAHHYQQRHYTTFIFVMTIIPAPVYEAQPTVTNSTTATSTKANSPTLATTPSSRARN